MFTSTHFWNSGRRSPYEAFAWVMSKLRAATQKVSRNGRRHDCLTIIVMLLMRAVVDESFRMFRRERLEDLR